MKLRPASEVVGSMNSQGPITHSPTAQPRGGQSVTTKEPARIDDLQRQIERLEKKQMNDREVLGSFITWVAQSAGSPISHTDAKLLLERLTP